MNCKAIQHSDQMVCESCGLTWDMNDPSPPVCGLPRTVVLRSTAVALYRPPFRYECGYIYDADRRVVADSDGQDAVMRVRGWGRIGYLPDAGALQDKVGELIAESLTKHWTDL